jgi:hypothetical protein
MPGCNSGIQQAKRAGNMTSGKTQRWLFALASLFTLLFLGLVFHDFVLEEILIPIATVLWILLRIFVFSINQEVFWWCLVLLAVVAALVRLFRGFMQHEPPPSPEALFHRGRTAAWRSSILLNVRENPSRDSLRRELTWLTAAMYSSRREGGAKFQIRDALQERQIPLPPSVHEFLFPAARPAERGLLPAARSRIRGWVRRRSGRDRADYLRSIDDVVTFMERSMEMTHEQHAPQARDR